MSVSNNKPSVYSEHPVTTPTNATNSGRSAGDGIQGGAVVGAAIGGFMSIGTFGIGALIGSGLGYTETDGARAAGRAAMTIDGEWKVPEAWWNAANALDGEDRAKAIGRLQQAQTYMDIICKYPPNDRAMIMARCLGPGVDMEDGSMGDVLAVIMSGQAELLPQLMGDDGGWLAFGAGDGLDDDEWEKIQENFTKQLGELKQTFDIEMPSVAEQTFDYYQNLTYQAYHGGRTREEDEEAERT